MNRALARVAGAFAVLVLLPAAALAQASISGIVRDTSGAILPGVTVEAASPVLIEKVRSTVTDSAGRYTIPDLRPGPYRVTFTLTGFRTTIRDGVTLEGTGVSTVNADLTVGQLEETITVSGESPMVDLQSTTRQVSIDQELVSAIPSSRTPFSVGVLIPGVTQSFGARDVGGAVVAEVAALAANGGRTGDQRMMVNGVALSSGIGGGWGGGAVPNATGTAEFAIDVSGVDAQAATGGVRVNFIPRDGGNRFAGTLFGSFANEDFAADNYTGTDVQTRGLSAPSKIKGNGDFNPGVGGPIVRDRVWFFLSGRYLYSDTYVAGAFHNANANKLNEWRYVSTGEQAIGHADQQIIQGRFTFQATPRNKFGVTVDQEAYCGCPFNASATTTPDGAQDRRFPLQRFVTADWTSPVTSRLLIEASGIHRVERWGNMHLQTGKGDNVAGITPGMTSVTDNPSLATGASLTYRSAAQFNNSWNWNIHYRAAVTYVTGSHSFKVGFNNAYLHHENTTYTDPSTPYSFTFNRGVPTQITYRIAPRTIQANVDRDMGLFVQDRWTVGRWSLAGGLRYDTFATSFPAQSIEPTALAPNLNVRFDEIKGLSWHDIAPKMGATYDLFGNGKTALKLTLNKYLEGMGTTGIGAHNVSEQVHPINRLSNTTTRSWNDLDGDFVPDCDLLNFGVSGECGALLNAAIFGTVLPGTSFDPDLMKGWGKRQYNWELTAGVQHEILPRVSAELQYARRSYGNFRITDDLNVGPQDYERFTLTVPQDSRLPDGGGYRLTAFDLRPTASPTTNYLVTRAKNYGDMTEVYNGVNLTLRGRLDNGMTWQGGFGTGNVVNDDCDIVDDLPEMLHTAGGNPTRNFATAARPLERCHEDNAWRTSVQALAAYVIPKIDVQVSGTFQNHPGAQLAANWTTSTAATTLGRPTFFTGAPAPSRFFNIVPAGEIFVERLNQIDLRVAKLFRMAGTRTSVNFDFYNVMNSNAVLTENATFGPAWRTPQSILLPRLFKVSAQFDF